MLPPQAFTSRDMRDAYNWVQTLPPAVRDSLKTMEQVVAFYLQSKRMGTTPQINGSAEIPGQQTAQDFRRSLKTLQTELEQFDFSGPEKPQLPQEPVIERNSASPRPAVKSSPEPLKLDTKSQQVIDEVRESLNLSSDMEVIRMSLMLAHKKFKDILS